MSSGGTSTHVREAMSVFRASGAWSRGGVRRTVAGAATCLLGLAGLTAGATGSVALPASPSANAACPVTVPTRTASAGNSLGPDGFNYGNARLRVQLYWPGGVLRAGTLPDGGSFAVVNRGGSIRAKVGWWLRDLSKLVIVGKRLDRPAPPLRAHIPSGYGPAYDIGASLGFQPTGLTFPSVGCWRVVGKAGTARLAFVVKVTKLK